MKHDLYENRNRFNPQTVESLAAEYPTNTTYSRCDTEVRGRHVSAVLGGVKPQSRCLDDVLELAITTWWRLSTPPACFMFRFGVQKRKDVHTSLTVFSTGWTVSEDFHLRNLIRECLRKEWSERDCYPWRRSLD